MFCLNPRILQLFSLGMFFLRLSSLCLPRNVFGRHNNTPKSGKYCPQLGPTRRLHVSTILKKNCHSSISFINQTRCCFFVILYTETQAIWTFANKQVTFSDCDKLAYTETGVLQLVEKFCWNQQEMLYSLRHFSHSFTTYTPYFLPPFLHTPFLLTQNNAN